MNAPYGTWISPIIADLITEKTVSISEVLVDQVTRKVHHVESRPYEEGRSVLVDSESGNDLVGSEWNVRSGVHEYGGAAATFHDGIGYFTHYGTKRLYKLVAGSDPQPVSPDNCNYRYGDFRVHPKYSHLIVSVLEDHTKPAPSDVVTTLVIIDTKELTVIPLVSGADFYSSPQFSPDGTKICWIQWHHPDMPWEGSELLIGDFIVSESGTPSVANKKFIAGKKGEESINQPKWLSDSLLVFLSDVSGYYNAWRYDITAAAPSPILPNPVAQDYADPAWLLGASRYAILDGKHILVSPTTDGSLSMGVLNVEDGNFTPVNSPFVNAAAVHAVSESEVVLVGYKEEEATALVKLTLPLTSSKGADNPVSVVVLKATSTSAASLPQAIFAQGSSLVLATDDNIPVHVLYYPPTNPEYKRSPNEELPPCVLNAHGGPTARVAPGLSWVTNYFTSRGWAWVDVNYGGSSGYGRTYRDRLRGNWGVVDVRDCVAASKELGKLGLVDPKRVAIRGGSAGGFTVLAALTTAPLAFPAGTSSYGISDLSLLASDTHKFESRYLEKLIGGTVEEIPEVYRERSPVNSADKIESPLLILQGSIDAVVPPGQAEAIVTKMKERGRKVEYLLFEGEGHGWRKAENIKKALETEEAFYKEVFRL